MLQPSSSKLGTYVRYSAANEMKLTRLLQSRLKKISFGEKSVLKQ